MIKNQIRDIQSQVPYMKQCIGSDTLALTSVFFAITKFTYISDVLIATIIHQHHTVMCTTSLASPIDNSLFLSHSFDHNIAQNEFCCKL